MGFLKGLLAFLYSLVHAWLINLVAVGIIFIALKIFSLSWFWIIIILLFIWGIIEAFRDLLLGIIAIPYSFLANGRLGILVLPMIYLVLNAIWFVYNIWSADEIDGTKGVLFCLFATYEVILLSYKSIMAMLAVSAEG